MACHVYGYKWKFLAILYLVVLTAIRPAYSQQMQAISSSKYSGINGISLNPSLPVLSPLYLDINLASANAFIQNNYIYIFPYEDKLSMLLKNDIPNVITGDKKFYGDYYVPGNKHGLIDIRIMGPSASLMIGQHSFGIYSGFRSVTAIKDMPHTLAKFFFEGLYFPPQYDTTFSNPNKVTFGSMHWGEVGLNYSGILIENYDQKVSIGLTAKRLLGYAGTYIIMNHLNYRVPNYDTLVIYNADLEMGLSAPVNYNDNVFNSSLIRGRGFGFDLGLTYERKLEGSAKNRHFTRLSDQNYTPYLFRIGASVTDLGFIRFTDNSLKLQVADGNLFWPGISNLQFENVNSLTSEVSNQFFGNSQSLIADDKFDMTLPTGFNLHCDLNLTGLLLTRTRSSLSYNLNARQINRFFGHGNWFVSGIVRLPMITKQSTISTSSLFSLATRYETRYFQAGLNATLWNYSALLIGANIRLGYFFLGTDDLLSFMKVKDYTGTNIYAGVKFNLAKGNNKTSHFRCPDMF